MSFLENIIPINKENQIIGLTNELKALYIYNKYKKTKKSIILVTSNLNEAGKIYNSLTNYTKNVWFFPMDDFLTSEAIAISPEFKISRLETINSILKIKEGIIITSLMGYLRYLPNKEIFKQSYITIKKSQTIPLEKLVEKLYYLGYKKQTTVNMTGEIAVRGFVLDIFPINKENPIRLEYWGEEIDTIKTFDVNTQRTKEEQEEITIYPNTELLINKDNFNIPYRDITKYIETSSIKDYLNNPITIYDNYHTLTINNQRLEEEIFSYNTSMQRKAATKYMYSFEELEDKNAIIFETFDNISKQNKNILNINAKEIELFPIAKEQIKEKLNIYLKTNKKIIICLENRYQINKLEEDLEPLPLVYTNENEIYNGKINLIIKKLNSGFETENYIIITQKELFNQKEENNYKTKFKYGSRIKDITKLSLGDYVVHGAHGIGRYQGIKSIIKNGIKKDYISVEYQGGDKLYIPVEKIDLITKYTGKEGAVPKLNKLGSTQWQKTKARAKKRAEDMATDLLELYAQRESKKGFAFQKDGEEQKIFEEEFEHEETNDQLKTTSEIKEDMQSDKPMDRLLCGDVGYGKTEVAFRAIFKCIMSGKQAAILCPTTILSSQHYKNAINRFKTFPVDIALLNRFVTKKETQKTLEELKQGKIDLLIGTHRILSDDVIFKDLGLLVIDEEQRFGVKHKEKIKKYKNNIDVLTLSATPIPRTLQMSMAGIRSLSLIETPPAQRYPIQTYVLAENNQIIKEAIHKEMGRGGQTFILFNRIENIESKKAQIQTLIPEAKIAIAHGRMDKNTLEKVMLDFSQGKFDILLCTTIIETGIDIPSANTLIIIDADRFGLSQLYQIRGRIGRSNKIAYCYLMYNNQKILSEIAIKRLNVIKEFTELGSGFSIAMRDLSIRGAGDLLGGEQSGFIDSIGIELFLEMLNEEVQKLQGKEIKKEEENQTNPLIDIKTSIEDNYVSDEDLKIEIHKKINTIDSKEKLEEVKAELEDRFGKIDKDMEIYMYEEWFEKLAQNLNITKVKQTKNFINIEIPKTTLKDVDGENLFYEISKQGRMFRFSSKENNLVITLDTIKLEKHFIYYLIDLMKIINKNIKK